MPTLTYKLDTDCMNCGLQETISLPHGSMFIEYVIDVLEPTAAIASGYHKNYNNQEKKTIKRCSHCRCATLIRRVLG